VSGRNVEHLKARIARYPKDWKAISAAIRLRAKNRCECLGECGLHHEHRCIELNGEPAHFAKGKIVLTTAHLNHTPEDCRPENLKAMCQRCHLRYDQELHLRVMRDNREARRLKHEPILYQARSKP
jgi:hypothetical protein